MSGEKPVGGFNYRPLGEGGQEEGLPSGATSPGYPPQRGEEPDQPPRADSEGADYLLHSGLVAEADLPPSPPSGGEDEYGEYLRTLGAGAVKGAEAAPDQGGVPEGEGASGPGGFFEAFVQLAAEGELHSDDVRRIADAMGLGDEPSPETDT